MCGGVDGCHGLARARGSGRQSITPETSTKLAQPRQGRVGGVPRFTCASPSCATSFPSSHTHENSEDPKLVTNFRTLIRLEQAGPWQGGALVGKAHNQCLCTRKFRAFRAVTDLW